MDVTYTRFGFTLRRFSLVPGGTVVVLALLSAVLSKRTGKAAWMIVFLNAGR